MSKQNNLGGVQPQNLWDIGYIYQKIIDKMIMVWSNCITIDGLPDEIDSHFIFKYLFREGKLGFFQDWRSVNGIMRPNVYRTLPVQAIGVYDVYGQPTVYNAIGYYGFYQRLYTADSVIIYANKARVTPIQLADYYALRLAQIEKALMINVNKQKSTTMLKTTTDGELFVKNMYKDIIEDTDAVIVYKDKGSFREGDVSVLDLGVKEIYPSLFVLYNNYWNDFLTTFGIPNANLDKKERMITSEAESNNNEVYVNIDSTRKALEEGFDAVNDMFGLDITVSITEPERMDNGSIYDTATDDVNSLRGAQDAAAVQQDG